jgi:hypothetical protein
VNTGYLRALDDDEIGAADTDRFRSLSHEVEQMQAHGHDVQHEQANKSTRREDVLPAP